MCQSTAQRFRQLANQSAPNACGLHFHKGQSCEGAEDVGGHYYHEELKEDPWAPVVYVSYEGGSVGSTSVATGKSIVDLAGHAFVVHDHTGGRVACGILAVAGHATEKDESGAAGLGSVLVALLSMFAM